MKLPSRNLEAHGALILMSLIWGLGFVFIKFALRELPPSSLVPMRFLLAAASFGVLLTRSSMPWPKYTRRDVLPMLLGALTGIAGYGLLVTWGLEHTTASTAGVLNAASAVFALILGRLVLGERLTTNKLIGIPIAIVGVVTVVLWGSGEADLDFSSLFGPLLVTGAMLSWAVCSITLKPLLARHPAFYVSGINILIGACVMLPLLLSLDVARLASLSWLTWVSLFYLGAISTTGGQFLYYYGLARLDASQAAAYLYLQPFLNAAAAAVLLGEVITIYLVLGGGLIIAGIAVAGRSPKKRAPGQPPLGQPAGAAE